MENQPDSTPPQEAARQSSPSLEKATGGNSFRVLALYSWLSLPIAIVFNIMLQGGRPLNPTRLELLTGAILAAIVPVTGVLAGLIAFFGIPRYGRKGILWPALTGLVLWAGLTALAIPTFNKIQKRAQEVRARAAAETPAVR